MGMNKHRYLPFAGLLVVVLASFFCLGGCSGSNSDDNSNSDYKAGKLYFVSTRDSNDGYSASVYSADLDFEDGTISDLTNLLPSDLYGLYNDLFVSPNGQTMFCTMTQGSLIYSDIRKIDIATGDLETLTSSDQADNIAPVFTTGHEVYYASYIRDANISQIRKMNTDGSDNTAIFEIPEGSITSIGLSPDESSLCLSVIDADQNYDIFRYDINSGEYINLTNTPTISEWSANYAPDGSIIYISKPYYDNDQTDIFRMDENGQNITQVSGGEEAFNGPLWQYDKWIVFQSGNDVWLYDTKAGTVSNLTGSEGNNYSHTLYVP
jgi:Tol biopolymer transport system component